jgi:hypothetical protein
MLNMEQTINKGAVMKNKTTTLLFTGLAACLLASCTTVKVHSWMDPQFNGRTIGKTMVLGIAESDSLTRQYEYLFVERLAELGVPSASLHAAIQTTKKISKEELAATLQEHNFDSILVTRLISETERQQVANPGSYSTHYGNYWGYYSHAYTVTYNTAYVQNFMEFELETNLYDVETRKLVWSGRTVVYDDRSDRSNMKRIIEGVLKDLGKKGML